MDYEYFCMIFEKLLNLQHQEKILKLVHSIFDYNEDRSIDELDIYCFYCTYEADNPEMFTSIYFDDVMKVIQRLH